MTTTPVTSRQAPAQRRSTYIATAVAAAVLVGIAVDTKIVHIGGENDIRQGAFSPDAFGEEQFPRIQTLVAERAIDAAKLAPAVLADKTAAAKQFGTISSTGAIMMVRVSGVVGDGTSGLYRLTADGVPPEIVVRVQTGPAINGTDLRDASGDIDFNAFKNQIEYQNAGSGINRAMKKVVLEKIDTTNLKGKSIEVVGAFRLINPKNWLITPVEMTVK